MDWLFIYLTLGFLLCSCNLNQGLSFKRLNAMPGDLFVLAFLLSIPIAPVAVGISIVNRALRAMTSI